MVDPRRVYDYVRVFGPWVGCAVSVITMCAVFIASYRPPKKTEIADSRNWVTHIQIGRQNGIYNTFRNLNIAKSLDIILTVRDNYDMTKGNDKQFTKLLTDTLAKGAKVRILLSKKGYIAPKGVETRVFPCKNYKLKANVMIMDGYFFSTFSNIVGILETQYNIVYGTKSPTAGPDFSSFEEDYERDVQAFFNMLWGTTESLDCHYRVLPYAWTASLGFSEVHFSSNKKSRIALLIQPSELYPVQRGNITNYITNILSSPTASKFVLTDSFFPSPADGEIEDIRLSSVWSGYFEYPSGQAPDLSAIFVSENIAESGHKDLYCSLAVTRAGKDKPAVYHRCAPMFDYTLIYSSVEVLGFTGSFNDVFQENTVLVGYSMKKTLPFDGEIKTTLNEKLFRTCTPLIGAHRDEICTNQRSKREF